MPGPLTEKQKYVICLLLLVLVAFAFQGTRSIWIPDEQRYTNIAVDGILRDNWLLPAIHHEHYHFEKPPLTYWAIRCAVLTLGWNEWAVRTPNALAFILTVILGFGLARRLSPGTGIIAPVILTASPLVFIGMSLVNTDTLLTLFETLAIFGFAEYRWGPQRRQRWLLLMWLGFALAFLTKGPPGLLPLAAVATFTLLEGGWREAMRLFDWRGLVIFALVGCSWYGYVVWKFPYLLHAFVANEFVGRIFTARHHHNPGWKGLVTIYVPTILIATLPWILLMMVRRPGTVIWSKLRQVEIRRHPEFSFLWIWLLLPLCVFLASQSRLPFYLEPLAVPFALVTARYLNQHWNSRLVVRVAAGQLLVLLVAKLAFGHFPVVHDPRALGHAVASTAGGPLKEVVVADGPRIQGLSLYTRAEVEVVNIRRRIPPSGRGLNRHATQSLREELAEREPHIVFLVPSKRAADFQAEARKLGYTPDRFGGFEDLEFFRLRPKAHLNG